MLKLTSLVSSGMKLFDAMVWLAAPSRQGYDLKTDPTKTKDSCPSMHEVARSVFYTYFFLITQARYPHASTSGSAPAVPNFLRQIMGMADDQSSYIKKICSFEPQKFDPQWIRFVTFAGMGQEALSRFGLGVAGYRLFGPFKIYKHKEDLSPDLINAYTFARTVAMKPATWDIHPVTRNVNILTKRGNLNKNLGNLILEVFTTEQIDEMVSSKMLYAKPTREPSCQNYLTWSPDDDISGSTTIFRN